MQEYKIGNAIIRIHGKPDMDNLKTATGAFLKEVQKQHKEVRK